MNFLEKAIFATIAYYDILNYPLTPVEIWRFLIRPQKSRDFKADFVDVLSNLSGKDSSLTGKIYFKNGFYFLKGREELVRHRIANHKISESKWRKMASVVRLLRLVPFVRMV